MNEKIVSVLREHWGELLETSQDMAFSKGQVLFYEGHYPYGLFVLVSGSVSFSKGGVPCRNSHLWRSPKGEVIGVEALTSDLPSCCTSKATEDCAVIFIPKSRLLPLLERTPNKEHHVHDNI